MKSMKNIRIGFLLLALLVAVLLCTACGQQEPLVWEPIRSAVSTETSLRASKATESSAPSKETTVAVTEQQAQTIGTEEPAASASEWETDCEIAETDSTMPMETALPVSNSEETDSPEETQARDLPVISEPTAPETTEGERQITYVANTNTKKFHYPTCSSVADMKEKNKLNFTGTREELIAQGYQPCKRCNP